MVIDLDSVARLVAERAHRRYHALDHREGGGIAAEGRYLAVLAHLRHPDWPAERVVAVAVRRAAVSYYRGIGRPLGVTRREARSRAEPRRVPLEQAR